MAGTTSILVLGAGELGTAVLQALAGRRDPSTTTLTVLLRASTISSTTPSKRAEVDALSALGVRLLAGDLAAASEDDLATLFAPFDTVIGCTGFAAGRGTQRKLARAVLAARCAHYVPWQFGVDYDALGRGSAQDLFDEQLDVRDLLRAQRTTAWTIVSTGIFTSFLFWAPFGVADAHADPPVVRALGAWDNRVTATTARDIGRMTAEVILGPDAASLRNSLVYVAGDTLSYADLADVVEEVTGRPVRKELWDVPMLQDELAKHPEDEMRKYRVVFAQGKGVAWDVESSFNVRRGIPVTNAADWARENLVRGA